MGKAGGDGPLTAEQVEYIVEVLTDAEASPRLTQWERRFVEDNLRHITAQGPGHYFTENQWQVFLRIESKIYETG